MFSPGRKKEQEIGGEREKGRGMKKERTGEEGHKERKRR